MLTLLSKKAITTISIALVTKPHHSLSSLPEKLEKSLLSGSDSREAFRESVNNTLQRRLFYIPSFKIYRGVAGFYDYGPPGCQLKSNVLSFWRQVNSISSSIHSLLETAY